MNQHLTLVAILIPSYEEGIRYFVDTLGFTLFEDTDQGGGKRWVVVGPQDAQTRFLLAEAKGEQAGAVGRQGGGRVWLFLQTDDFARDHAAFLDRGVIFEEAPRCEPYGWVAVFRDPWGNRWDLLERA